MKIGREREAKIGREGLGLFFEDINFAADGGLYAEMLENRSFEVKEAVGVAHNSYTVENPGYGWHAVLSETEKEPRMQYVSGSPVSGNNPHYLRFTAQEAGQGFANKAYDGIVLKKGMTYRVSFYARCVAYEGEGITVRVTKEGKNYAETMIPVCQPVPYVPFSDLKIEMVVDYPPVAKRIEEIRNIDRTNRCRERDWIYYEGTLTAEETVSGAEFEMLLQEKGIVEFDLISMIPEDAVAGIFRKDLFDALKAIQPGFVRFPGGCIVEGVSLENRYQWKNTVGALKDRRVIPNLWAFGEDGDIQNPEGDPLGLEVRRKDPYYSQSFGLGFYEFFLLCELLGAKPLPVLNIGTACQFRSTEIVEETDPEFLQYIQDALDLIEFANGPVDSPWGSLRAAMGHPASFGMDLLAVGNEQWNTEYLDVNSRYSRFEAAIHEKYPEMRLLGSAGPVFGIPLFDELWDDTREKAKENPSYCYAMDEHYYMPPAWFYDHVDVYDTYPRTVGVFAGEYAAHTDERENSMESALAEAAFLTGLERNADVVLLASYAPLMNRIGHSQWKPDLIWFDAEKVYLTPNYQVQRMYGCNRGEYTLKLSGQEKELREKGIYVSVSETVEQEVIIKVINKNSEEYDLPLTDENGTPLQTQGKVQILLTGGEKPADLPETTLILEKEILLEGSLTLPAESFTVLRFFRA